MSKEKYPAQYDKAVGGKKKYTADPRTEAALRNAISAIRPGHDLTALGAMADYLDEAGRHLEAQGYRAAHTLLSRPRVARRAVMLRFRQHLPSAAYGEPRPPWDNARPHLHQVQYLSNDSGVRSYVALPRAGRQDAMLQAITDLASTDPRYELDGSPRDVWHVDHRHLPRQARFLPRDAPPGVHLAPGDGAREWDGTANVYEDANALAAHLTPPAT